LNNSSLPVSLISFRAACQNEVTTLYWATASETNNDYFTLERSVDGNNFEFVFKVSGAANSNDINTYTVTDDPLSEVVYYRLTQTDFDGTTKVLKTIASTCNNAGLLKPLLINNCEEGFIEIQFNSIVARGYSLTVHDVSGRNVYQQSLKADEMKASFIIPVDTWGVGVYSYTLFDGKDAVSEKFVIE